MRSSDSANGPTIVPHNYIFDVRILYRWVLV